MTMGNAFFLVMVYAFFLVPIALIGLLLFRVVSGGVTARKVMYGLLGIALVGLADFGSLVCAVGYEAVSTGINPRPWWEAFWTLLIAPLLGYVFVLAKLVGSPRLDKKNTPTEV
jgi:hypothetical protein